MTIEKILEEIIRAKNGSTFDSHEIILEFARNNQNLYITELNKIKDKCEHPFTQCHAALGRKIKIISESLGYKLNNENRDYKSANIFGFDSPCSQYEYTKTI